MPEVPPPTSEDLLALLRGVVDPELGSDVVDLGMIPSAQIDDQGRVTITVALTIIGCPLQAQLRKDIQARVGTAPGVTDLHIDWVEMTDEQRSATMAKARWNAAQRAGETAVPTTTRVLAISSGKGGVGKSSIAVNLATGLAAAGFAVGLLDADIGGFSVPRMAGLEGRLAGRAAPATPPSAAPAPAASSPGGPDTDGATNGADGLDDGAGRPGGHPRAQIVPHFKAIGPGYLEVVSMGLLVEDEGEALLWRGQLLNRALQHFLEDVSWGPLDYLIIDTPPGTGDVQMGLARMLPRTEVVLVTTPAIAAQRVAARAADLARKTYLRIVGVVENMSAFTCEHGESYPLFGEGGGQALADEIGAPLLASIPLERSVVAGGDIGEPAVLGEGPAADALRELVRVIAEEAAPPIDLASCSARLLAHVEEALAAADS